MPQRHPLRKIRQIVNDALASLDADFARLYSVEGRPSIAPEKLLRASLLQAFFSVRSERQLMEQLDYNLLFRWFVGLGVDDPVWDATVFTKNRDRLLDAEVAAKFLGAVLAHREVKPLLSNDHFSVDGTLVEAWASLKSFRAKNGSDEPPGPGRNGERNFHNETRSNQTHASTTDPDAKLYRKSSNVAAKLSYIGHALAENRHGLIVAAEATRASSRAEREAALAMIERHDPGSERRLTLAADKGYDTRGFVAECRRMCVAPHVAAKVRHSAIDRRTTRHAAYAASQRRRKLIEEAFGWAKTIAGIAKVKVRGLARGSTAAAMTVTSLIEANTASAQIVKADDPGLKTERVTYPGEGGNMTGYLCMPAGTSRKLPAVIVIHENRGLVPHIQDVTRRMALEGFLALGPDFLERLRAARRTTRTKVEK